MLRRWKSVHVKPLRQGEDDGDRWHEISKLGEALRWFGTTCSPGAAGNQRPMSLARWRQISRYFLPSRRADFLRSQFKEIFEKQQLSSPSSQDVQRFNQLFAAMSGLIGGQKH